MLRLYEFAIKLSDGFSNKFTSLEKKAGAFEKRLESIGINALRFNNIEEAVGRFNSQIQNTIQPGIAFETNLKELQAVTGVTGDKLTELANKAKAMSMQFGGAPAENLAVYTGLLSELSPEIAKNPAALDSMGKSVQILSKTMQGDSIGAMKALSTGLNQFNIDLKNPIEAAKQMTRQMNVMAAAEQIGNARVTQIAEALRVAGSQAYQANISFEETNAALQVLGKSGLKGAEGGTALRNVLIKLGEGRFLPKETKAELQSAGVDINKLGDKSISLADRLTELKKISKDSALIAKLFGSENANAGSTLLQLLPLLKEYTAGVTGTNKAVESAKINMSSYAEQMKRNKAVLDVYAISIFDATKNFLPLIQMSANLAQTMTGLMPVFNLMYSGLKAITLGALNATKSLIKYAIGTMVADGETKKFKAGLLITASQGLGTFIINLFRSTTYTNLWSKATLMARNVSMWFTRTSLQASLMLGIMQNRLRAFTFKGFITGLYQSGLSALRAGKQWIWSSIVGLGAYIKGMALARISQIGLNVAMSANPIGAVVVGLLAIGAAVYAIIKNWDSIKVWLGGLWDWFQKYNPFMYLWQSLESIFPSFTKTLSTWWDTIVGWIKSIGGKLMEFWNAIAPTLGLGEMNLNIESGLQMPDGSNTSAGGSNGFAGLTSLSGATDKGGKGTGIGAGISEIKSDAGVAKNITINVEALIKEVNFHKTEMRQSVNETLDMLKQGLLAVVNDANTH